MGKSTYNLVDRAIGVFSPVSAMRRAQARFTLSVMEENGLMTPGSSRRSMRGWRPTAKSADQDILPKIEASRAGCRDLAMNSPLAIGALKRERTNVAGWGLRLQSRIDREILGFSSTDERAQEWEKNTEREFRMWASSSYCDMEGASNFYELQQIALYNTSLSGDLFYLLPYKMRGKFPYSLKVKLVEADNVVQPQGTMNTWRLAGGIEVDDDGAPARYHFRKNRPNSMIDAVDAMIETVPISTYGPNGRRNVYHLFHKDRPGQRRGIPMLAPVIEPLKQITRLTEAELMASVVASFFTVFVKTNPAYGGLTEGFIPQEQVTSEQNPADENIYEMGSGNVIELGGENQSIDIADPKRPNGAFEPFFLALVKQIGTAIEIPFEQLILHFSASYSAARGAILEAWKFYRHRRVWLSSNFCQPIYEAFLEEAVLLGRVDAPGFFDDPAIRQAWCGAAWSGPGQGQLNPLQETQAADLRIKRYLSTYETEYSAIHGEEWSGAVDRVGRERNILQQHGLPLGDDEVVYSSNTDNDDGDNKSNSNNGAKE